MYSPTVVSTTSSSSSVADWLSCAFDAASSASKAFCLSASEISLSASGNKEIASSTPCPSSISSTADSIKRKQTRN